MSSRKIISKSNPSYSSCPSCKESFNLTKSRARNLTEKILKTITPYTIYRCKKCGWRGYISKIKFTKTALLNLLLYILLALVTALIANVVIRRIN